MLSKLILLISFSGAAFGQTVVNGQNYILCASSVVLNPSYLAEYLDLNCAVTSLTIPSGAAGKAYHLTVYQDGGSLTSVPAAISGDMTLNATGYTSFRMVWDQPTSSWRTTKIGVLIPTRVSQLTNDAGFVTSGTVGPQGPIGLTGATGTTGAASTVPGPTGPSGTTYLGTCTVAQTATVALLSGPRTVSSTCTGVVSGGLYFIAESAASLSSYSGYGIFAGSVGTAANTLSVTTYAPALAIGASYTITFAVWKMN